MMVPDVVAGSGGASVALRLLKERADSAEAQAASAVRQVAELKASLQVKLARAVCRVTECPLCCAILYRADIAFVKLSSSCCV